MPPAQATALERLMRPLSSTLTVELARALIAIRADAETQARYDDLASRHNQGSLTGNEKAELDAIVQANTLLGILKAEAQAFLTQRTA